MVARPLDEVSRLEPVGKKAPKDNAGLAHEAVRELGNFSRLTGTGTDRTGRAAGVQQTGHVEFPSLYSGPELARTASLDLMRRSTELPKGWDQNLRIKDAGDAPKLPKDVQDSKEACLKMLADRLGPDSETFRRVRDEVIPKMEKDILSRHVETKGGRDPIDMRRELKDSYDSLTRLGSSGEAERLTFTDQSGITRPRFSKEDVDNILVDAMERLSDRRQMNNQGHRKQCAGESITRVLEVLPSQYTKHLTDLCTKGAVELPTGFGGTYLCQPDASSLRVDQEGKSIHWGPENKRGAAGVMDVLASQYNLDLVSMSQGGPPGRYRYVQEMNPLGKSSTGEHVYDTWLRGRAGEPGKEIARNPCLSAERISNVIQGLVGHRIADDFGQRMTVVSEGAFGYLHNVTNIRRGDGEALARHLRENQDMGWEYAVIGTHTGNYRGSRAGLAGAGGRRGGWHATGGWANEDGTVDIVNNWGKKFRPEHKDANLIASWMEAPHSALEIDRQRRDHILGPDRRFRHQDPFDPAVRAHEHNRPEHEKVATTKDQDKDREKVQGQLKTADVQRRIDEVTAQLAQFRASFAALAEDDPRKIQIKALLADAEVRLNGTVQELPRV
jgi:hypothetical protein